MRTAAPSGKRLWLLWVIATNLGWFPGIALGSWLGSHLPAESLSVLVSGLIAGAFVGAAQARVLPRAIAGILARPVASSIGWALGILGQDEAVLRSRRSQPKPDCPVTRPTGFLGIAQFGQMG